MTQRSLKVLLKYEGLNTISNFFTPFFGLVFPVVMGTFLLMTVNKLVPLDQVPLVKTNIAIVASLIIPMSTMLVSFPAIFSQEVEQGVLVRLSLFGFSERDLLLAKVVVHYLLITGSFWLYAGVMLVVNDVLVPAVSSLLIFLLCFYLLATLLFIFAYAVGSYLKKFGTTYGVTMTLYFFLIGLSGMMGVRPDQLPNWGQKMAYSLPMAYLVTDFGDYWVSGFAGYNFVPLIQSFLFLAALVALVYLFSWYGRRGTLGN